MSNQALYTETVTLPSQGLLNPEIPEGSVTQRCMMVSDKKYIAGTKGDGEKIVEGLVARCVTAPEKFDITNLIPADLMFLLLKLRILSYGEDYSFKTKCPECGKRTTVKIKLSDIEVHKLEDDYQKHLSVTLPNNGSTVYTRILTIKERDEVKKEVKRLKKKFPDMDGDPAYTLNAARIIERVELVEANKAGDKELTDPVDILQFVEQLTDYDMIAIQSTVENIKVGVNPLIETECEECDESIDINVAFDGEFFRPKYESKSK
jgi:T4 bacteriophage base plate protein